ncbi:MAG: ribonuclease P protein subunit [Candidatus Woesearchaeota archaeon]|nr:ribonuclease P protein subunit [Candidatus Woesearchaeota archaeon]
MTKELMKKELIGMSATIIDSRNKSNIGINGKIIDETKNCIMIKTEKGEKKMIKDNITIEFDGSRKVIEGSMLSGRPEERIKRKAR